MEKERAKWKIYWEPRGRMAGFGEGNEKRRTIADKVFSNSELAREKMWSRIHLIPVLQAEEDRDLVRRHWAEKAREKELLGAETKVYNNDKYVSNSIITFQGVTLANGERADLSALHTPSRPRTPPSKEVEHTKGIWGGREEETHVVYILRDSGAFFQHRQPSAGDSIKCSFKDEPSQARRLPHSDTLQRACPT